MTNTMIHDNWDSTNKKLYGLELDSSNVTSIAVGTILTHYAISEWIWNSAITNNRRHRSPTWIVSVIMFWILWTLLYDEMEAPGAHKKWYYIANGAVGLGGWIVNLMFTWLCDRVQNRNHHRDSCSVDNAAMTAIRTQPETELANDVETPKSVVPSAPSHPAKPKAIVDYINNIKIFLTHLVILYHIVGANSAPSVKQRMWQMTKHEGNWESQMLHNFRYVCGSFFMSLFFFYSGFFVPRSFDKKSRYDFLLDRVKRLGIPYVVYTFFIGPYVHYGLQSILFGTSYPAKLSTVPGPMWFLNQLMIFCVTYAFACGKGWSPKIHCPTLLGFLTISLVIGLLSGATELFFPPSDRFWQIPSFWSNFLSYPVFFFGGAIAQRNDWMEDIKEKSRVIIYMWVVLPTIMYISLEHHKSTLPGVVFWLSRGVIWKGLMGMGISLAVTVFFMDYANRKYYFTTQFFSKAMYTAYIIQYFPQLVGMKYAFSILEGTGYLQYEGAGSTLKVFITDDNLLLPFFLLTSVITQVITWPVAYAIRSIPGFSQVL